MWLQGKTLCFGSVKQLYFHTCSHRYRVRSRTLLPTPKLPDDPTQHTLQSSSFPSGTFLTRPSLPSSYLLCPHRGGSYVRHTSLKFTDLDKRILQWDRVNQKDNPTFSLVNSYQWRETPTGTLNGPNQTEFSLFPPLSVPENPTGWTSQYLNLRRQTDGKRQ